MTLNRIIKSIEQGLKKAQRDCRKASNMPIWDAPEYLMTVALYQSIYKNIGEDTLTLETSRKEIKSEEKHLLGRRIKTLPHNARVDILIWRNTHSIKKRAIIEVKRNVGHCYKDIARLIRLMKESDIEFAISVSSIHFGCEKKGKRTADNNIMEKLKKIEKTVGKHDQGEIIVKLRHHDINTISLWDPPNKPSYRWRPVCFVIRRKKR